MRVGGSTKISVDTRLVCATLRPLDEEVRAGRFRADLYYRIQGVTLNVPPLRERHADIAPLVHQFVAELSAKHGVRPPKVGRTAMNALREYGWPGNVRELRNAIELVCLLRAGRRVRPSDLPEALGRRAPSREGDSGASTGGVIQIRLDKSLDEIVQTVLEATLKEEGGNRSRAARRLGISLRTVQRRMTAAPSRMDGERRRRA
jgi:DNA-binding NtrC family response regulator